MIFQTPHEGTKLASLVGRIVSELERAGTGDLAELRRLVPDDPGGPAFWRIVVTILEPADALPTNGPSREQALRRWAAILRALATLAPFHDPRVPLGRALAEANVSEHRLNRLLRSSGETLFDHLRAVTHQLASKATAANLTDLAHLVLSDGRSDSERIRQEIANDYYRQLFQTEKSKSMEET